MDKREAIKDYLLKNIIKGKKDLGYDEYLKYFTDYYDAYKAALK